MRGSCLCGDVCLLWFGSSVKKRSRCRARPSKVSNNLTIASSD
jgi:hypothetical protein